LRICGAGPRHQHPFAASHAVHSGRKALYAKGFPNKYQQYVVEEMRDVDLSEIAHLALGEDIPEHLKRRNRAFLAGIGGLNFQKEELRTMTWAEFGVTPWQDESGAPANESQLAVGDGAWGGGENLSP
jgi:hypothetical protein